MELIERVERHDLGARRTANAMYVRPAPLALVLGIALLVAFAFAMHWVLGRWFTSENRAVHNYVAGTIVGVVGTLYAVVLGIITVVVWQQYDGTRERLALETAAVTDTWHYDGSAICWLDTVPVRANDTVSPRPSRVRNVAKRKDRADFFGEPAGQRLG